MSGAAQQGWVGVDLDGTLARWGTADAPPDIMAIGEPVPVMLELVKRMLAQGVEVRIFTARVGPCTDEESAAASGLSAERFCEWQRLMIEHWCKKHLGRSLTVTATKDFHMCKLYDDRAVQVMPNSGMLLEDLVWQRQPLAAAPTRMDERARFATEPAAASRLDTGADIPRGGAA
jgi:hypothetical protein